MVEITQDLLRKRAEHNEMMLTTLEEVSLHQQNIKEITNLDVYCRHLKILYLQNNLIEVMSGMNKLKELEYINLAVNSISKIEGIKRCESLNKLDMTLNFVDLEDLKDSCEEMEWCENLNELYFTGNPCTDWEHYREYVLAKLPQVMRLDGTDVTRSERLTARTRLADHEAELAQIAENNVAKKEYDKREGIKPTGYTKEERWAYYVEQEEKKVRDDEEAKEQSMFKDYNDLVAETTRGVPEVYTKDGVPRQCNQGKYTYSLDESPDSTKLIFNMEVPRFMDTNSLNVDLQPQYCRVTVKGKVTQIRFDEEILVEQSTVQRSTTTGWLCITMPKANIEAIQHKQNMYASYREENKQRNKLRAIEEQEEQAREARITELKKRAAHDEARSDAFRNGTAQPEAYVHPSDPSLLIQKSAANQNTSKATFVPDFDEDEVPPLE